MTFKEALDRSCWDRWFGALTPGSMRGSIFALMSTAIGAGVLSLPYVLYQTGVVIGVFFLIISAAIAY